MSDTNVRIIIDVVDKNAARNTQKINKGLFNTENALKAVKVAAAAAAVVAVKFAADFAKDATLMAARADTLAVVTEQMGKTIGLSAQEVRGFEEGIQAMGITTIASREAVALLMRSQIDLAKSSDLARLAQNAAVIAGEDSSQAFTALSTIIATGNTLMARRRGLMVDFVGAYKDLAEQLGKNVDELTDAEKSQARLNEVMEKGESITGVYEASMETAGKKAQSLKRHYDELKIVIGDKLQPAYGKLIDYSTDWLKETKKEIESVDKLNKVIDRAARLNSKYSDALLISRWSKEGATRATEDLTEAEIDYSNILLLARWSTEGATHAAQDMIVEYERLLSLSNLYRIGQGKVNEGIDFYTQSAALAAIATEKLNSKVEALQDNINSTYSKDLRKAVGSLQDLTEEQEILEETIANAKWWEDVSDAEEDLKGVQDEIKKVQAAWKEQTANFIFDMAMQEAAIDGFTEEEFALLNQLADEFGLTDDAASLMGLHVIEIMNDSNLTIEEQIALLKELQEQARILTLEDFVIDVHINVTGSLPDVASWAASGGTVNVNTGNPFATTAAAGLSNFVVPPGYNDDSFGIGVKSGETVNVTPPGQGSNDFGELLDAIEGQTSVLIDALAQNS